jgi:hypothetical protein
MAPIAENTTVSLIDEILSAAMQDESTFDRCDQMYNAQWRSAETFRASELNSSELDDLLFSAKKIVAAQRGVVMPAFSSWESDNGQEFDNEHECESYFEKLEDIDVAPIKPDDLIVCLCNYKGEGEGFALLESAKHLPVYQNKSASAARFGA